MIEVKSLHSGQSLPLLIEAGGAGGPAGLLGWYEENRELAERELLRHGALLFRGFGIDRQEIFEDLIGSLPGRVMDYVDGNSPRKKLGSGIYTSTEYPPEFFISMHNELSYAERWPARLLFCCVTAPEEGGATPLADSRAILGSLRPDLVELFAAKGIKYIRNLHGGRGLGPSWQTTYETEDRAAVEEHCRAAGIDFAWTADGSLSLSHVRPAVARHPVTGEGVWFNQADQFHPSTHPRKIYDSMMLLYKGREHLLPQDARFGDGSPIPLEVLEEVRATVKDQIRTFPWQRGDLLLVDNVLVCHGRMPFKGPRKILVSMLEL